jgi:sulfur-carrier protein adenylyltransferase/sulfurtransferase
VLPGIIGVIQANEALKIAVGYGDPLVGRLLLFDAQSTSFEEMKLKRDPECPTCGKAAMDAAAEGGAEAIADTGEACA